MPIEQTVHQEQAVDTLRRAFAAGKVPHAYIFAGPAGIGKLATARRWAALLLCTQPVDADGAAEACGACESCRLFAAGTHGDYAEIYKELITFTAEGGQKASPLDLPIDVIRRFLVERSRSGRPFRTRVCSWSEKAKNSTPLARTAC
jgi:DNA polymerase III delta prime subunit